MKKLTRAALSLGLGVAVGGAVTGCMTGQDKSTLDLIAGSLQQPYVEAYIEYQGPQQRWAGPANWVMHVTAKDSGEPEIILPDAWRQDATSLARKPASHGTTAEESRAKIGALAASMEEDDAGFHGCLAPVHVRLVRQDGYVVDKQGCRDQSHWAKAASEAVDYFLSAAGN